MKVVRSLIGFLLRHYTLTTNSLREVETGRAKENGTGNSSMSLFDEIQNDIVSAAPLSTTLLKAKVLAYRLKNEEFKSWVEDELNGYDGKDTLPEYRKVLTESFGNFMNMSWHYKGVVIPISVLPSQLREDFNLMNVRYGVRELESFIETIDSNNGEPLHTPWPAELLQCLANTVYHNMYCYDAWWAITKGHVTRITDTIRTRLLTFILELAERYPEEARADFNLSKRIPDEQIRQVFNYFIMGGEHNIVGSSSAVSQGGNMAIFDQRNQQVNYQYNAAGDINFDSVQNRVELTGELQKLKDELSRAGDAGVIDAEIVTDAEYQITKAIQQTQKSEPNKKALVEHLQSAKSLLDSVTAAAGMATALIKAVELARTLF